MEADWVEAGMTDFGGNRDGNVAITFALLLPVLFVSAGIAIDFQARLAQKASLQEAADTLSLRGARELLLDSAMKISVEGLLEATAPKQFASLGDFEMTPAVDTKAGEVTVMISQPSRESFFLSQFIPHEDPIIVRATAQASGGANVCVISLDPAARDSILLSGTAKLTGAKCAIFANSTNSSAIGSYNSAKLSTKLTCSGGGYGGASMNYDPVPVTDCPIREDPLVARTPPTVGPCNHTRFSVKDYIGTLQPGVYCSGMAILGNSQIQFAPGVYVIKDGDMEVLGTSRIAGTNVGFYFVGNGADLFLYDQVEVEISGRETGLMSGMLIWQEPSGKAMKVFEVASNNVRNLTGTIYIPNGKFLARASAPVGQSSAYTAIVAKKIELLSGANLVLNTNYDQTSVPVPDGIGGTSTGGVRLRM